MKFSWVQHRSARVIVVALSLVLVVGSAAAAAPILGTEKQVSDTDTGSSFAQENQPEIASNGTDHLAVWQDQLPSSLSIRGTFLSDTGAPLDGHGFEIGPSSAEAPDVATDGTDFLVVFQSQGDILGAFVDALGSVGAPFPITPDLNSASEAAVSWDGTNYLVVWTDYSGDDPDLFAAQVSPEGVVQDPITIAATAERESRGFVASSETGSMIVWTIGTSDEHVYGTIVDDDGTVADVGGLPIADSTDNERAMGIASNGSGYLVTWDTNDFADTRSVLATRLDETGAILDAPALVVDSVTSPVSVLPNDVASNGTDYVVTWWRDSNDSSSAIRARRITGAGAVQDGTDGKNIAPLSLNDDVSAVTSTGTDYMLLYGAGNLFTKTLAAADGTVSSQGQLVTTSATQQISGDIAAGPNGGYLAVWSGGTAFEPRLMAARLSSAGDRLDGPGILLGEMPAQHLRVAWNGSIYLLVWHDGPAVKALRVSSAGAPLDETPFVVDTAIVPGERRPDVAAGPGGFLVVWRRGDGVDTHVWANTVDPSGALGDAVPGGDPDPFSVFSAGLPEEISVAAAGDSYLVSWTDPNNGTAGEVAAATFDPDAVTPVGPKVVLSVDPPYAPYSLASASNGETFAVAWAEEKNADPYFDSDVWLSRVGADGEPLRDDPLGPAASVVVAEDDVYEEPNSIVWDGSNYFMAYSFESDAGPRSRKGLRLSETEVLPGDPFDLGLEPFNGNRMLVSSSTPGMTALLYPRLLTTPESVRAPRLLVRVTDSRPPSATMTAPGAVFQKKKGFTVGWTKPSDMTDVRRRSAGVASSFGSFSSFRTGATTTGATFTGAPGSTYCFSARSRNADGYFSSFSAERCTAVPLDERQMSAKGTWAKKKAKGYYLNTFMQSSKKGASLSKPVKGRRFALVATKGPGHGTVKVFLGKALLKKVPLSAPSLRKKQVIALKSFSTTRSGKLRIVVVSSGKPVRIEGLGVSAV